MRSRNLSRNARRTLLGSVALTLIVWGCGDADKERLAAKELAAKCALNSDCNDKLICVFERCHEACRDETDCDPGQRCVRVPVDDQEDKKSGKEASVCQLPEETACRVDSDCKGDQRCAADRECRDPCGEGLECTTGQVCALSGDCALHDEVDLEGALLGAVGGSSNSGASGSGGEGMGGAGGDTSTFGGADGRGGRPGSTSGTGGTPTNGGTSSPDAGEGGSPNAGSAGSAGIHGGGVPGGNSGGTENSAGTDNLGGTESSGGVPGSGGAGGEAGGGAVIAPYFEETDAPETVENNDRDHVLPMPSEGSLWLPPGDEDWFYIDVPDDGRAHVIDMTIAQAANMRAYVRAYAEVDDSQLGSALAPAGTTRNVYVTVGSGTRTHIAFVTSSSGRLDFTVNSITAELDEYEPNNDQYSAKPIALNTDVSGQQIVPYSSQDSRDVSDWYEVTLGVGPVVVNVVSAPANVGLAVHLMDDTNSTTELRRFARGVIGQTPAFNVTRAGKYRFRLTEHSNSSLDRFYSGPKPESLYRTYTVRVEQ
jgi:hypothetical protein